MGHLRAYHDFSESTNLDVGVSYSRGHRPVRRRAQPALRRGRDLRWKPLRRAIYHSFVARSELVWAAHGDSRPAGARAATETPFGYYVSGDYQFARRWFLGGRFDRSQRGDGLPTNVPTTSRRRDPAVIANALLQDTGGSLVLTYWPSEFSQIRGQFRRTRYGEGLTANELLFQFLFSIGAHGAHPF